MPRSPALSPSQAKPTSFAAPAGDLTTRLPVELKQEVLKWTGAKDFFALSGVNRAWHEASDCLPLLKQQYARAGAPLDALLHSLQQDALQSPTHRVRRALHRHTGIGYLLTHRPHRLSALSAQGLQLQHVSLSPRGDSLSLAYDKGLSFFATTMLELTEQRMLASTAVIVGSRFSPDGSQFMLMTEEGNFVRYTTQGPRFAPVASMRLGTRASRAYFSADGQTWLTHDVDTQVAWLSDLRTDPPANHPLFTSHELTCAALSEDGAWAVTGDSSFDVILWNTRTHPPSAQPLQLNDTVALFAESALLRIVALAISPDSRYAAAATPDGQIDVWNLSDLTAPPHTVDGRQSYPHALAFSRDNRFLASAAHDSSAKIFDLSAHPVSHITLREHTAHVLSIAFSDDNRFVLTASADNSVVLYDFDKDAGESA